MDHYKDIAWETNERSVREKAKRLNMKLETKTAEKITLVNMKGSLLFIGMCTLVSFIVFIIEIVVFNWQRWLKRWKRTVVFNGIRYLISFTALSIDVLSLNWGEWLKKWKKTVLPHKTSKMRPNYKV